MWPRIKASLTLFLCTLMLSAGMRLEDTHDYQLCLSDIVACSSLELGTSSLTGPIPTSLGLLTQLEALGLEFNRLTGAVPTEIGALKRLNALALNANHLTGAMPTELGQLTRLDYFGLDANKLTGTMPTELGALTQLVTSLIINDNSLEGSVPTELGQLTSLDFINLSENSLTGTVPTELGLLALVNFIDMSSNSLTGSMPTQLGMITTLETLVLRGNGFSGALPPELARLDSLASLELSENRLTGPVPSWLTASGMLAISANSFTGSVPTELGLLTSLYNLMLSDNRLSGSVPKELGSLTFLKALVMSGNSLTHTVPSEIGLLTTLAALVLSDNRLTGTVPTELGVMTSLDSLCLGNNSLTGSVPSELGLLTTLSSLIVHSNALTGTLPPQLSHLTSASLLALSSNSFSGTLPALPYDLSALYLHQNRFVGALPSLANYTQIKNLSVFKNSFVGRLTLPANSTLELLYVHQNRLSCSIRGHNTTVKASSQGYNTLVLPCNMFSGTLPEWVQMREVPFMYAQSVLDTWGAIFIIAGLGLFLLVLVMAITKVRVFEFLWFTPTTEIVQLSMWSARLMCLWSIALCPMMVGMYYAGANYFECGKTWLRGTITYLSDDPVVEWVCAAAACIFGGGAALSIRWLEQHTPTRDQQPKHPSLRQQGTLVLVWGLAMGLFSLPSFTYAASAALPPANTIGVDSITLKMANQGAGFMLWAISAHVIPRSARLLTRTTGSNLVTAGRLIIMARLLVSLVVPFVVTLLMHEGCLSLWLRFWTPCSEDGSFTSKASLGSFMNVPGTMEILKHSDICAPSPKWSACARNVLDVLTDLWSSKLIFAAFVSPAVTILAATPAVRSALMWVFHKAKNCHHAGDDQFRVAAISIDSEVAGIVMLVDLSLVLGFCVPWIVPLCSIALALHAAAYHVVVTKFGVTLQNEARPSTSFLWVSLALGWVLVAWFFFACNLHGAWLVATGVPVVAGGVAYFSKHWWSMMWSLPESPSCKFFASCIMSKHLPAHAPAIDTLTDALLMHRREQVTMTQVVQTAAAI